MSQIKYGERSSTARRKLIELRAAVTGKNLEVLNQVIRSLRYKGLVYCPECGAGCKIHKHTLSGNLVRGLATFYKAAGNSSAKLSDIVHERNLIDNFQKLKYFGLVVQAANPISGAVTKTGYWRVTTLGRRFLKNLVSIPKSAFTDKGIVVETSEDQVLISEVKGTHWDTRPVYAENARLR